jgi:hypothetical protein
MSLFMKKFKKYIKNKKFSKGDKKLKSTSKRACYNCGKHGHFIANCPYEHRDDDDFKKKSPTRRTRATREVISPTRRSPMVKLTLGKNGGPMMRAPTLIVMVWQPWLSREHLIQASLSSQSLIMGNTLALW